MKAVVFIHGYLSSPSDFGVLPSLLKQNYDQVIQITLPGHGENDSIKDFNYYQALVLINEILPQIFFDYEKVDLIGFSLGGAIARYLAIQYPVNRLVLLAPSVYYFSPLLIFRRLNYLFQNTSSYGLVNYNLTKGSLIKNLNEHKNQILNHDKDALKYFLKVIMPKFNLSNGITFVKLINYMNQAQGFIKASTLIIWGYLDELVPYFSVKKCYDDCINQEKELMIIPYVGHMLLRSKNMDDVIIKIKNFLKG